MEIVLLACAVLLISTPHSSPAENTTLSFWKSLGFLKRSKFIFLYLAGLISIFGCESYKYLSKRSV